MHIVGVVAEYNPFHNGHKYQLEQTRLSGATHIVVVMSGDVVQRGDVACFSKYDRARAAVENGADLVIELPAPYSCSSAELFAENAVGLLAGLGENIVEGISFGCENDDVEMLERAAQASALLEKSEEFRKLVSSGMSYPKALQECAEKLDSNIEGIFSQPNNVLAIEYIKAAKKIASWINPYPVQRKATGHNCSQPSGKFISATALRQKLKYAENCSIYLPYSFDDKPTFLEEMDKAILFKLITSERNTISKLPDVNENLLNRFMVVRESNLKSVEDFAMKMKSKNITLARIRRMILHLALGITEEDIKISVPYGRILAFNKKGTEILSAAKNRTISYDTSLSRLETDENCRRVAFLERNAVSLREMCAEGVSELSNEYKRKITIYNGGENYDET